MNFKVYEEYFIEKSCSQSTLLLSFLLSFEIEKSIRNMRVQKHHNKDLETPFIAI